MPLIEARTYVERMEPMKLARTLRDLRLQAGFTQVELATRLAISQTHVSAVELGKTHPPTELVDAWASTCGFELRVAFATPGVDDLAHRLSIVEHRFSQEERAAVESLLTILEKRR